jgi:peptide chain release factor 1
MRLSQAIVAKLRERARRFDELTEQLADPEVAANGKRYTGILRERGSLEQSKHLGERLEALIARREEAEEILRERPDPDLVQIAEEDLEAVDTEESTLEDEIHSALVAEPEDERTKLIVEVRAGTGGDEATLFAADLFRMYRKYAESRRWKLEELELHSSEVGGYKEIIFALSGAGSWRSLRFESGVHRVQRVPVTETQGRIHTSAATVAVLPEPEEAEIAVRDEDLRIDTMRAGGPGGQSVNKTSSAVRITHEPTGTVVICQDEKSQHKNKAKALRILRSRLLEAEVDRLHAERAEARRSMVGTGDRSARVRTYNWPQNRVSDHRLGQNFSLESIVEGRLEPMLEALAAMDREERVQNL